jgi:hypothetical protein
MEGEFRIESRPPGNQMASSSVDRMEAMFSIIWILAIGWLAVALANGWQMRSIERDWENLLREHGAPPREPRHLSQSEIIEIHR